MTSIKGDLLEMLWCPVTRANLRTVTAEECEGLNDLIRRGGAGYANGGVVEDTLDGGLTSGDGDEIYPVRRSVPVLVPAERIVRSRASLGTTTRERREASTGPWGVRWNDLSLVWDVFRPPLRPYPEDIVLLQALVEAAIAEPGGQGARALMLGVTPEIAEMRWPDATCLLALDSSDGMIRNVWPGARTSGAAVRAEWETMPVRDAVCDVVVGDGIFTTLAYPADFDVLVPQIRRVMKDGGTLFLRLFARPERREPVGRIFEDLRGGLVHNIHGLPWRLAMALHGDLASGTRLGDIWEAWEAHVPDPSALMASLDLPPETVRIMEVYRGVDACITMPTLGEVREMLARDFEERACHVPDYDSGDRYPTLVMRARHSW